MVCVMQLYVMLHVTLDHYYNINIHEHELPWSEKGLTSFVCRPFARVIFCVTFDPMAWDNWEGGVVLVGRCG